MMYKLFFFIIVPALLSGAQEYISLSHQISDSFVKEYSKRNGVSPSGLGGGMMNDIDLIILTFTSYEQMDINAARRLYVDGVEDLLNRYNNSRVVRKYLHNFPFKLSNLQFMIGFKRRAGGWFPKNFVAHTFNVSNNIHYGYFDHELDELVTCFIESYEDAVRIVQAERQFGKGLGLAFQHSCEN